VWLVELELASCGDGETFSGELMPPVEDEAGSGDPERFRGKLAGVAELGIEGGFGVGFEGGETG
jgi:hypothetical protein